MKQKLQYLAVICLAAAAGFITSAAVADGSETVRKTVSAPQTTATANAQAPAAVDENVIRLTPDGNKIIHLEQDAASVIVNNPKHVGVVLDNPRLLVVMPKEPGTTSFTVLDASGKTLFQSRVIVSGAQPRYIRIRRMCSSADCVQSSYFYCPDGCYEVNPVQGMDGAATIPDVMGAPAGAREPVASGITPQSTDDIPVEPPAQEPQ